MKFPDLNLISYPEIYLKCDSYIQVITLIEENMNDKKARNCAIPFHGNTY